MTGDDSFGYAIKAFALQNIFSQIPKSLNFPSRREAEIQVDKLERMAKKFTKQISGQLLLTTSAADLRRKKGPELRRLAEQEKRVDKLMTRLFMEIAQASPEYSGKTKAERARFAQTMLKSFDQRLHTGIQKLRKSATKTISDGRFHSVIEQARAELENP